MRRHIRAAVAAAALGTVLVSAGSAQADTVQNNGSNALTVQNTADGFGEAYVWWVDGSGNPTGSKATPASAKAEFYDYRTGYTLNGWLERSTDGGKDWQQISGTHALSSTTSSQQEQTTDPYYDGPGYLARACFQFTSWSGAAVHCSPAI